MYLSLGNVPKASTLGDPFCRTQLHTTLLYLPSLLLILSEKPQRPTCRQRWPLLRQQFETVPEGFTTSVDLTWMLPQCWSVLRKSAPGQSEVTGSGAYSYVTYLSI